ncbi:alpha/beta fold hydrolase [Nocardioides donggukensis]|uniref:Alpha/beta fold hydrolase n=1 Tax=Nocardioides donggukensis TaxID=2774019 RepID=A0A927PZD3_9ACTN|nr:alpha/beta fold hydrolase [Nocardioides donggukensis]MBD8869983.1 alpha/beta fold hydrolase [Nocardioides donggukensis]
MRARLPDQSGFVERDGVRVAWEEFGSGPVTVLLMPTWSIVPSASWKAQVPYLARHFRVVTFDGRGSGRSDRPEGTEAYLDEQFVADALAVLDATGTERTVVVGFSCGAPWSLKLALEQPGRVLGVVAIGPALALTSGKDDTLRREFAVRPPDGEAWPQYNKHTWLERDYDGFLRYFFGHLFSEPHSTKQIEDGVGWGHEIGPERLVDTEQARLWCRTAGFADALPAITAPVLVVHGDHDRIRDHADGVRLAELTGGSLVTVAGGGHAPHLRDPVAVNHLIRDFVDRVAPEPTRRTWTRAVRRPRRALYLSSPIGLGHARRDLAIATELRKHHPDLEVDWLTQDPVAGMLEGAGERVHPASAWLASESAHFEDECAEHDLHAFQAIRRMDEILVNNFMVFSDLVAEEHYDLVVGDEAWDVDYFLHENPELKRFAFAWLTDFVGWLPMTEGGEAEARLTADHNAEMLEQRERYHRVRDASVFVGNPRDVVPADFGPGLPSIRSWTEANFDFAGYVTGFDPPGPADRARLRSRLGYRPDDVLCVVTVGGSGVGEPLLRRVLDAVPRLRRTVPELKFLVATGPRIDPATLPRRQGVRVRGYLPDLHRHLAAADVALVQGGLTTCMELTACGVPFVYVPLRRHFEQNHHVRHRLAQYDAGRCLDYEDLRDPSLISDALLGELRRERPYRPVETDGAARAAALLAPLL